MKEDIEKLEKDINYNKRQMKEKGSYIPFDIKLTERVEKLLKAYKEDEELIHIMKAEFERLESIEDNTDMLKFKLKEANAVIEELKKQNQNFIVNAVLETHKNATKNLNDLELLNEGWKQEIEIKDKIIEEMARRIYCDEYRIAKENGNALAFVNSDEVEEYFGNKVRGEKE